MSQVNQQFNFNLYLDTNSNQFSYKNSYDFTNPAFQFDNTNNTTPQLFGLESGYDVGSAMPAYSSQNQNFMQEMGTFLKLFLNFIMTLFNNMQNKPSETQANNDPYKAINGQTLFGSNDKDKLKGTNKNDYLYGAANDDKLKGGKGDDTLIGGAGNDKLVGGKGNDKLVGGIGDDKLFGGKGDDVIYAGQGNDKVKAGKGNDTILVNSKDQHGTTQDIKAGKGDDRIVVDAANGTNNKYQIKGGAGKDTIELNDVQNPIITKKGKKVIVRDANGNTYEIKGFNAKKDSLVINGQKISL